MSAGAPKVIASQSRFYPNTERVMGALQRSADGYVDQLKVHLPRTGDAAALDAGLPGSV